MLLQHELGVHVPLQAQQKTHQQSGFHQKNKPKESAVHKEDC
jgi:hypothetical protein